jgi:hypothetical protein
MIRDEFEFYDANQAGIVDGHLDEFVVIKDCKVRGYYKIEEDALDSMVGEKPGTFMVHKCKKPEADIAHYFNNAVAFV